MVLVGINLSMLFSDTGSLGTLPFQGVCKDVFVGSEGPWIPEESPNTSRCNSGEEVGA